MEDRFAEAAPEALPPCYLILDRGCAGGLRWRTEGDPLPSAWVDLSEEIAQGRRGHQLLVDPAPLYRPGTQLYRVEVDARTVTRSTLVGVFCGRARLAEEIPWKTVGVITSGEKTVLTGVWRVAETGHVYAAGDAEVHAEGGRVTAYGEARVWARGACQVFLCDHARVNADGPVVLDMDDDASGTAIGPVQACVRGRVRLSVGPGSRTEARQAAEIRMTGGYCDAHDRVRIHLLAPADIDAQDQVRIIQGPLCDDDGEMRVNVWGKATLEAAPRAGYRNDVPLWRPLRP